MKTAETKFSNDQFASAYPDGIEDHWWSIARSQIVEDTVRTFAGSRASVLEIGCGRGLVVNSLRESGINCSGVELASVEPIDAVKEQVYAGIDATELPQTERQQYDTLLLLDVIEYIEEPVP